MSDADIVREYLLSRVGGTPLVSKHPDGTETVWCGETPDGEYRGWQERSVADSNGWDYDGPVDDAAVSALAALARLVDERDGFAARLRDAPLGGDGSHWVGCWRSHIDCAAARVDATEAALRDAQTAYEKRDAALIRASDNRQRAESAEARVAQLQAALESIREQAAWLLSHWTEPAFVRPQMQEKALDLARAALAVLSTEGDTR